jgi:serine/threonine protein phosphatase PrpC
MHVHIDKWGVSPSDAPSLPALALAHRRGLLLQGRDDQGFYGIYDGHGGKQCVEFVATQLHDNVAEQFAIAGHSTTANAPSDALPPAWEEAFLQCDRQLVERNIQFSGATIIISIVSVDPSTGKRLLYTANAGDARAVLARGGSVAERLSFDHKGTGEGGTGRGVGVW